jgi:hypothetical protein
MHGAIVNMWKTFKRWLQSSQAFVALISALAALAAALIACWQIYESRKVAEAQTYLELRQRYTTIAYKLDEHDESAPLAENTQQWRDFTRYWYVSFDEWYVTRKLDIFPDLWETYYSEVFVRALKKPNTKIVFCKLRAKDFSEGVRGEFADAVEQTYKEHTNGQQPCN